MCKTASLPRTAQSTPHNRQCSTCVVVAHRQPKEYGCFRLPYSEEFQLAWLLRQVEAGLLTSFQRPDPFPLPPLLRKQWTLCRTLPKELTAAGQSEIFTPFPFNRRYANLNGYKNRYKNRMTHSFAYKTRHG